MLVLNFGLVRSQSISDTIYFNNYTSSSNNDLTNHFWNTSWITMDTIYGITGGALNTPNTLSWGNDLIWYCKNYDNVIDTMITTSVCFKWNSALINTSTYDRAAAIFLMGDSINHNVAYYLNRDRTLTVITYGAVQNSLMTLTSGHWYRLVASYKSLSTPPGDHVYTRAEIFDLGTNGLATPVAIGNTTLPLQDSSLTFSGQFNVRISGAKWGGGEYLDNFSFHGIPGTINCIPVGLSENNSDASSVNLYPQPSHNCFHVKLNVSMREKNISYTIADLTGREIIRGEKLISDDIVFDTHILSPGIYFLNLTSNTIKFQKQIIIE